MTHLFSRLTLVVAAFLLVTGCSKEDTEPPVITVLGSNPIDHEMRTNYVDPGATAEDNEDGDISNSIQIDDSQVQENLPGTYTVFFSVSDNAGNLGSATRTVNVFATANALAGNYSVIDTCGTGPGVPVYTYNQTVTAVVGTNQIQFNKFADYSGNTGIQATVASNGALTLPLQSALNIGGFSEDHDFQGTGAVSLNGFVLNYTDRNNSVVPVSTAACRAYFTRL
jgi:hypothetical protein